MAIGSWKSPFPLQFGGGSRRLIDDLHRSVVANRPSILHGAEGTRVDYENRMIARMIATGWRATRRRLNNWIPSKLSAYERDVTDPETGVTLHLSPLERWERVLQLSPAPDDTLIDRRQAVAGKLSAVTSNAAVQVQEAMRAVLGDWYYSVETNSIADVLAGLVSHYWPDGAGTTNAPGAASGTYPWWSAVAHVYAVYTRPSSATQQQEDALRQQARAALDDLLPAWCTYDVSRLDSGGLVGFYTDTSSLDYTAF